MDRSIWKADLEALCNDRSRALSVTCRMAQAAGEVFCDALVKRGYLNTRLSYRELFWLPVCSGLCCTDPDDARDCAGLVWRVATPSHPFNGVLATVVRFGCCRWDGRGGSELAGQDIPLVARFSAVVATYVSNLPQVPVIADHLAALDIVCARAGRELDPTLVELFVKESSLVGQKVCEPMLVYPSLESGPRRLVTL